MFVSDTMTTATTTPHLQTHQATLRRAHSCMHNPHPPLDEARMRLLSGQNTSMSRPRGVSHTCTPFEGDTEVGGMLVCYLQGTRAGNVSVCGTSAAA